MNYRLIGMAGAVVGLTIYTVASVIKSNRDTKELEMQTERLISECDRSLEELQLVVAKYQDDLTKDIKVAEGVLKDRGFSEYDLQRMKFRVVE